MPTAIAAHPTLGKFVFERRMPAAVAPVVIVVAIYRASVYEHVVVVYNSLREMTLLYSQLKTFGYKYMRKVGQHWIVITLVSLKGQRVSIQLKLAK
jgi:hypothetical protein